MSNYNRKPNRKDREVDITHLVNFNYEKPKDMPVFNPKRGKQTVVPFSKEQFLQANYHFMVSSTGDYSVNMVDPDIIIDWDKVEQLNLKTTTEYNCPICLDLCTVAPKVSRCGHVFCFPCILRHLSYGTRFTGSCPICFAIISLKDLKSAVIEHVRPYNEGDIVEFQLLRRARNSTMVLPRNAWKNSKQSYPNANDPDTRYCRFAIMNDIHNIIDKEREQLSQALWEAKSCRDDSVPFIESSLVELDDRETAWISARRATLSSSKDIPIKKETPAPVIISSSPNKAPAVAAPSWDEPGKYEKGHIPQPGMEREKTWEGEETTTNNNNNNAKETKPVVHEPIPVAKKDSKEGPKEPISVDDFYLVYQSNDGQQVFLHPLDTKVMLNQFQSYENFPETIKGKILEVESHTMTDVLRKRFKFLSHLPLTCQFRFVEIDMRGIASKEAIQPCLDEIMKRNRNRKNIKRKEELEKLQEEQQKKGIHIDMSDFPAPNEEAIFLESLKDMNINPEELFPTTITAPSSKTESHPVNVPAAATPIQTAWPPTPADSPKPSFLEAAKANKIAITGNMQVKNKKGGKQVVLFSNSARKR